MMQKIIQSSIGFYYSLCGLSIPEKICICSKPSEFSSAIEPLIQDYQERSLHRKMLDAFYIEILYPLNQWILSKNLITTFQQTFNVRYRTRFLNFKNQRNLIAETLFGISSLYQSIKKTPPQDYFIATYIDSLFNLFLRELPEITEVPGMPGLYLEVYRPETIFLSYFTSTHAFVLMWPDTFQTTDSGILHSSFGPSLQWADEKYYFYSGWWIPSMFYENPSKVSPATVLGEKNVEKRRAYMEILGSSRYAELLDLEIRDQSIDRFGNFIELYRTRTADALAGEHLQFVKVTCPSTGRNYMLCVPPHILSAVEAVAWTFGKHPDEYNPVEET